MYEATPQEKTKQQETRRSDDRIVPSAPKPKRLFALETQRDYLRSVLKEAKLRPTAVR